MITDDSKSAARGKMDMLQFSEEDVDLVKLKWRPNKDGYARACIGLEASKFAHHVVCERTFGRRPDWSKREVCDHINRDILDNRRENLRIVSVLANNRNHSKFANGVGSVTKLKHGKWQATASFMGRGKYIGVFATRDEALVAASNVATELNKISRKELL